MESRPVWRESNHQKKKKRHPLLITITALVLALAFIQFEVSMAYEFVFGRRFLTTDDLGLMTVEDFPDLKEEPIEFKSDRGQTLRGGFYFHSSFKSYKGVVVVSHGFGGGGYAWYLPQVSYLTKNGYLVLAFDKTGADSSDGKEVRGLPQGIIDLSYALDYVRNNELSKDLPILLYGHSWGGYSSCAILKDEKDITAVASLSGFNESQDMLLNQGVQMFGRYIKYLSPFIKLCDYWRFGKYASYSSLEGLEATDAQVILLHSDDDSIISINNSFLLYKEKLGERENLKFIELDGKKHDVYFSSEATTYRVESRKVLKQFESQPDDDREDNEFFFFLELDRAAANAIDEPLMNTIVKFFDEAVEGLS